MAEEEQKKRRIRKGIAKVKSGIGKARIRIGNARRKVQLIKPILLVDGITLSNAMFGLLSIFASVKGYIPQACIFMIIAVVMDFLDGKIARRLGRTTELGKELDSLADIVSFGAAPAVLGFVLSKDPIIIIPLLIFISCGIIRLAKFNVQLVKGAYFGMPITMNGLIFPLIYFSGVPIFYWYFAYFASAVLMVSPFKLKKVI
ncbi:CDP-diacylglycerol--serine O-phosphatidyltransferase [Candidatus Woesearchaeota archaeon]|nr:CDP-diacylglycerol--serine O-phosphatidyltransferase [Candidatus Woesearchaeota archaeon]